MIKHFFEVPVIRTYPASSMMIFSGLTSLRRSDEKRRIGRACKIFSHAEDLQRELVGVDKKAFINRERDVLLPVKNFIVMEVLESKSNRSLCGDGERGRR